MNRRIFLSGLGKFGLTAGTAAVIASSVSKSRDLAELSVEGMAGQIDKLKRRLNALEGNQKKMLKFMCIFAAASIGFDISLLI